MTLCSACGAPLARGMLSCPKCLLPLTAQAIIVPVQPRPLHLLPLTIGFLVATVWISTTLDSCKEQRPSEIARKAALVEKAKEVAAAHRALEVSSATPQAFEARCGKPTIISHGVHGHDLWDLDTSSFKQPVTYIYRDHTGGTMHVIFTGDKDADVLFREYDRDGGNEFSFEPYEGMVAMGCLPRESAN